jgi:hypothetical protein
MSNYDTFFTALVQSTLVHQIYLLWKVMLVYALQSTVLLECVQLKTWLKSWFLMIQFVFQLHRSKQGSSRISEKWHTAVLIWPSYFIYQLKYQQIYKIMGCFDTTKLSESGIRNGSVTPVWGGRLLVYIRFCIANMLTDARRFVASRGARRSGIAAPLWHIWLPVAPLRHDACKSSPALHLMHARWIPNQVLVCLRKKSTEADPKACFYDVVLKGYQVTI